MSRTGTKEQDARARAREARLSLLADRNAQDQRIEAAVAVALLAWEDRTAAAGKVEDAERDTAAGLALLSREKVRLVGRPGTDVGERDNRRSARRGRDQRDARYLPISHILAPSYAWRSLRRC